MATAPGDQGRADVVIGVVEDADEDYAALARIVSRVAPGAVMHRWCRAEEVLEEAEAERQDWPDLLLIDLSLPGIDGAALVLRLRGLIHTRSLPLFILSGSNRQKDIDRSYAAGASLYLVKPMTPARVEAALELLRDSRRERPPTR